ncbi:MAG: hypothetical protein PHV85_05095 [Desulfovibrionaceae bacterium]|nr:hypothetical protein [Desulfovibrionaceae bacterium]
MPAHRTRYSALPTLARFHASKAFFRGVMGPVGSGKSTAMCMEIMRRAKEQGPGPDGVRRTRWLVVRNTYRELADTTLKTWLDWFPEAAFGPFRRSDMVHSVRFADVELEVLFRALDRPGDVSRILSLELTGAWINEAREVPKALVDAVGDRVERYPSRREGGCAWAGVIMDTNPPDTDHWWFELAEGRARANALPGWEFFRQPGGLTRRGDGFVPNPAAENLENLPPDYYRKRLAGKSLDHVRVYYCAEYGFVSDGRPVYPEFVESVHLAAQDLAPVPGLPLFVGLDFGLTPAAVFGQRLASGRWQWLDELVAEDMGMVRFAELLRKRLNARYAGWDIEVFGDPAGMQRSQVDERTPFDILRAVGVPARPAPSNDFLLRREAVALTLSRLVDGAPGLVLSPACPVLRKGMAGGYCLRRVRDAAGERFLDRPDKNRFSHVCEAGQYLMIGAGEGRMLLRSGSGDRQPRSVNEFAPFRPGS